MRVLHVIDNLQLGGTQNLAWRTWDGFSKRGLEIGVCVLGNSPREHQWDWLPENVFRLACHGDYRMPGAVSKWGVQLSEVVGRFEPTLVHSWLWLSDVVAAGAAARRGLPHLSHVVDRRIWMESTRWKHQYRKWLTKRLFRKADSRFLAVSQAAAEFAIQHLEIQPRNIGVAYNSVDVEKFASVPDSPAWSQPEKPLRLGIAARIVAEKGHRYLLDALKILKDRGHMATLQITGEGPDRPLLEQAVAKHGLHDQVAFVGWVESVTDFLSGIDVFMVPSIDSEGLPTTILEAMAAGRAVVASNVGGAVEAIRHNQDGLIVPPRDALALANAIQRLSEERPLAATLTTNARQRIADQFSMPAMLQTIQDEYSKMVSAEHILA